MRLMKQFVLKLVFLLDSEVDGAGQMNPLWISAHLVRRGSPFWHSLLLSIPY